MGRVSQAQAQENRKRVVASASRMFREKGTAVSVADLMKAVGLTHGGFYKQFSSKENLVEEAIAHAFENPAPYAASAASAAVAPQEGAALGEGGDHEAARQAMIDDYLSIWHRDHAADGCPVSGFAADLGRDPEQAAGSREIYANGVRNRAARLATGDDDGLAQFCTLVGALALARATRGNPLSEELLRAARTALTESGGEGPGEVVR